MKGLGALVAAASLLAPAARAEGPRAAALPRAPIRRVDTKEPVVAITFDACATRTQTYGFDRKVYEILDREKVPATIFTSGHWVDGHGAEMAELARDPLIGFGDHSYDHPHMTRLSAAREGDEIDRTEAALARYGKKSVAFRPPFGDWSVGLVDVVRAHELPTVTWDVVSADPSKKTTKAGMIRNVVDHARPGSIVIFHINGRGWRTAEALPDILAGLRARGLRFVPLAELLALGPPVTGPNLVPFVSVVEVFPFALGAAFMEIILATPAVARAQSSWIVGIQPWRGLGYEAAPLGRYLGRMAKEREVWVARGAGRGGIPLGLVVVQDGFLLGGFVSLLAVTPEASGQGVGRALMEHVAARVFKSRAWLFVSCDAQNPAALSFYRKLGFQRVGRLPDLIKPKRVELLLRRGR